MSATDTMEQRRNATATRSLVLLTIFGLLALFFALNFRIVVVNGPSMEPTYKNGDRLLMTTAYWLFGEIQKGDVVVVVRPSGELLIKRVDSRTLASEFKSNDGMWTETIRTTVSRDGRVMRRNIRREGPTGRLQWTEVYEKR